MSKHRPCGSSWGGFWKKPDRYNAWLEIADCATKTADGYARHNRECGFLVECETAKDCNKLFLFAYNRAKHYRPDWVEIYGKTRTPWRLI